MSSTSTEQAQSEPSGQASVAFLISGDELLAHSSPTTTNSSAKKNFPLLKKSEDPLPTPEIKDFKPIPADVLISAMASRRSEFEKKPQEKISVKRFSEAQNGSKFASIPFKKLRNCTSLAEY